MARAPKQQSVMRKPVNPRAAEAAGRTQLAMVPPGGDDLDRAVEGLVAGDVEGEHGLEARVGGGLGEGERVVDGALDLRGGAGPVCDQGVPLLGEGDREAGRLSEVDAVVVDPVLEAPNAVRQLPEGGAGQPLRVVDQLLHGAHDGLRAVALDEAQERRLGDVAGGQLGAHVPQDADGHAHVLLDEPEERLVRLAGVVHLHRRDAEAFLVRLRRLRVVGAGDPTAHVGLVADRRYERQALAPVEDRLQDEDVRQVHPALERVVQAVDVAGAACGRRSGG